MNLAPENEQDSEVQASMNGEGTLQRGVALAEAQGRK